MSSESYEYGDCLHSKADSQAVEKLDYLGGLRGRVSPAHGRLSTVELSRGQRKPSGLAGGLPRKSAILPVRRMDTRGEAQFKPMFDIRPSGRFFKQTPVSGRFNRGVYPIASMARRREYAEQARLQSRHKAGWFYARSERGTWVTTTKSRVR